METNRDRRRSRPVVVRRARHAIHNAVRGLRLDRFGRRGHGVDRSPVETRDNGPGTLLLATLVRTRDNGCGIYLRVVVAVHGTSGLMASRGGAPTVLW